MLRPLVPASIPTDFYIVGLGQKKSPRLGECASPQLATADVTAPRTRDEIINDVFHHFDLDADGFLRHQDMQRFIITVDGKSDALYDDFAEPFRLLCQQCARSPDRFDLSCFSFGAARCVSRVNTLAWHSASCLASPPALVG